MKKLIPLVLALALAAGMLAACNNDTSSGTPASQPAESGAKTQPAAESDDLNDAYTSYEDFGKVTAAVAGEDSVYIVAEGYDGYHIEDDPSMTAGVTINSDGTIQSVEVLDSAEQTEGYPEQITDEYLAVYAGQPASPNLEVDMTAGATITSRAVLYAVQTAAYYAENVYGYVADTNAEDRGDLEAVYPADYTTIQTSYEPDSRTIGTVLYAAEGVAPDGTEVVALKVRGAKRFNYRQSSDTGWDAAEPSAYTMVIVIDKATDQVIAWEVLTDGTREKEYFTVPDEAIDTYMEVPITGEDVFDDYREGLVFDIDVETEVADDGMNMITGTSIIYTGASEDGTFSSQMVRNCFKTAAYFYANYQ